MSNSQPTSSPTDSPGLSARIQEPDPQVGINPIQIGASTAAAVTAALAASFFGVTGTLVGAAVGSIISTVAGTLYAHSLQQGARQLKTVRTTLGQKSPALLAGIAAPQTVSKTGGPPQRPWYRRPAVSMSMVGLTAFALALVVMTASEGAIGRPWSGGHGGTTLSHVVNSTSVVKVTPSPVTTDPAATASATTSPSPTASEPTPTATSTSTSTDSVASTMAPAPAAPAPTDTSVPQTAGPTSTTAPTSTP